ncbi:hypothetical protein [Corallococcus sp. CA047B]|uniref:hypothetical protein n=1 Tax=Corallococcus sp. CA047B TaxID=2316729 RepID=UPI0011C3BE06|nr:hypothetical protein [Corallococcus sp. CA047B]
MIRSFWVWGSVLLLACTSTSEGLCDDDSGCLPGLRCEQGVCTGCADDDGCEAWQACTSSRRCALRPGMCATQKDCRTWEECGASHTCQLVAGSCQSSADCKDYEECSGLTRKCVPQADRCTTADDCGGGLWTPTCGQDNRCGGTSMGGNDVLLWGTLLEGLCGVDAISSILTPTRVQVGFDCDTSSSFSEAVVAPNGRVYYIGRGGNPDRIKIMVPESFTLKDKIRSYPVDGPRNDTQVPSPACSATQDIGSFVMRAGTGAVAYNCSHGGNTYYNSAGDVVATGHRLLAWNAAGYLLGVGSGYELFVLAPDQQVIPITGLPGDHLDTIDARAHPTGFMLAMNRTSGIQELWHVDNSGAATVLGTYGEGPAEADRVSYGILDAGGALYSRSSPREDVGITDLVVKRPPDGSRGTIIYSEKSAPTPVNAAANYEKVFNFMHASHLFAGP